MLSLLLLFDICRAVRNPINTEYITKYIQMLEVCFLLTFV